VQKSVAAAALFLCPQPLWQITWQIVKIIQSEAGGMATGRILNISLQKCKPSAKWRDYTAIGYDLHVRPALEFAPTLPLFARRISV
jgi:hypothetical protein